METKRSINYYTQRFVTRWSRKNIAAVVLLSIIRRIVDIEHDQNERDRFLVGIIMLIRGAHLRCIEYVQNPSTMFVESRI